MIDCEGSTVWKVPSCSAVTKLENSVPFKRQEWKATINQMTTKWRMSIVSPSAEKDKL